MAELIKLKTSRDLNLDICISLKNRYVYSMVSKAASSTVTYYLQMAEYYGSGFTVQDVNNAYMSPHVRLFQLRDEEFVGILNSSQYRKVAFVRNPYARLLSCYLHRIIGDRRMNPSRKALFKGLKIGMDSARMPSFQDFIEFISDQDTLQMERHWVVQHDCILYSLIDYDFIGRQENLIDDLLRLERLLFGNERFDRSLLGSLNCGPMITGANGKLRDYYDERLMARVADRYKVDFEVFGYSTELPA